MNKEGEEKRNTETAEKASVRLDEHKETEDIKTRDSKILGKEIELKEKLR